jgi:hypothetical protein
MMCKIVNTSHRSHEGWILDRRDIHHRLFHNRFRVVGMSVDGDIVYRIAIDLAMIEVRLDFGCMRLFNMKYNP